MTRQQRLRPLQPIFDVEKYTGAIQVGNTPPSSVGDPPVACFTWSASTVGIVDFDASCSTDADGTIVAWAWDFGDSNTSTTGPTVQHSYASSGTYNVSLVVTDDQGMQSVAFIDAVTVVIVPGLIHWWDASNVGSITVVSGGASQIDDLVGTQHMMSGTNMPLTGTRTLDGKNVLDFVKGTNTTTMSVSSTGQINIGAESILLAVVVSKDTQASGTQMMFGKQTQAANTSGQYGLRFGSGDTTIQAILQDGATDRTVTATPGTVVGPQIIVQVINREQGSVLGRQNILRQNGVTLATSTWSSASTTGSLTTTNSRFGIGYTNGSTGQFDGGWAEGRVYRRATDFTPAEVAAIEAEMMAKWGL